TMRGGQSSVRVVEVCATSKGGFTERRGRWLSTCAVVQPSLLDEMAEARWS
ncbi:hypothetical protein NEUTE1DRAFT_18744, partial [Neurospora tetrasperma FGSC 2508]